MKFAVVALGLCAVIATTAASDYYRCGHMCKFTFCDGYHPKHGLQIVPVGKDNDKAVTPPICDKYGKKMVGVVGSSGQAYVVDGGKKTLISHYAPHGLKQHFSPSFFKSFSLYGRARSGVGHETPQQNQLHFLDQKCILLPIKAYQVLNHYGHIVDNMHPHGHPFSDCIAFKTEIHEYEPKHEPKYDRKREPKYQPKHEPRYAY